MNSYHIKYMLLGGAGVFGVLLLVGIPLTSALLFAILLACPLMMLTMCGHRGHRGHDRHDGSSPRSNEPREFADGPIEHQHRL